MERFWSKVAKSNDCWTWTAMKGRDGYGLFKIEGRRVVSHRVAWELTNGPIPEGLIACHTCDNPSCVNPAHLFLGTHQDNADDRCRKARGAEGERQGLAKLTSDEILTIRNDPRTSKEIAPEYGVHWSSIAGIKAGRTWRSVGGTVDTRPKARLTPDDVRAIRADGRGCERIAADYGISFQQVRRIIRREKWANI